MRKKDTILNSINNECVHHWLIDSSDRGRCKKCGATRDFGKELRDARKRK